jgi:hypothetical protein
MILTPLNLVRPLLVTPHFRECHLIDLDADKVAQLRDLVGDREDIFLYDGDCNMIRLHRCSHAFVTRTAGAVWSSPIPMVSTSTGRSRRAPGCFRTKTVVYLTFGL